MVFGGLAGPAWVLALLAAIAVLGGTCAWVSTARFASALKVSNAALLLSFPFGFSLYALIGYFMPVRDAGETEISVQYKWYGRLINFLSGTRGGLVLLGLFQLSVLCLISLPGSWILAIVFAILWATVGAAGILRNVKSLSWLAVAVNLITIIGMVLAIEFYPAQLIQMVPLPPV
jgi:hypothetical protein